MTYATRKKLVDQDFDELMEYILAIKMPAGTPAEKMEKFKERMTALEKVSRD
jgi:cytochrome c553